MLTLDIMEKLLVTFGLLHRGAPDYTYAEEPIAYYFSLRAGATGAENGQEKIDAELTKLRADVQALAKAVDPRRGHPRPRPAAVLPQGSVVPDGAQSPPPVPQEPLLLHLKTRLGVEVEERLDTIKERVIARKVHELLKGQG